MESMNDSLKGSAHHRRRMRAERRFFWYGRAALFFALTLLALLILTLAVRGAGGFMAAEIRLEVDFSPVALTAGAGAGSADFDPSVVPVSAYGQLAQAALRAHFPASAELGRAEKRQFAALVGGGAGKALKTALTRHPEWAGTRQTLWIPGSARLSRVLAGEDGENETFLHYAGALEREGAARRSFNTGFFLRGDSRDPDRAGFAGAVIGSLLTVAVCLAVAFPFGVGTALYLEEFARKNRFTDLIEVNINNLAAVPSIIFGLLGLAVFLGAMGLPRSAPLVGGLTLAMMVLPVIIIATRSALKGVPQSIRQAALALGASPLQVAWHHTLPLAMPGIMTGAILAVARALGETAPLLMVGMVAFVADIPQGFTSPATAMPVQIFLWAASPEAGFAEKTAAGILVLIAVLLALNALAIFLRRRYEVRW